MGVENFFNEGKEWSKIKDSLLCCYLKPYFTKIEKTRKKIVYIDAFAGAGIYKKDKKEGSPLLAYKTANENLENFHNIEFMFIEKEHYKELEENIKGFKNCIVISGNYEEEISNCLKKCENKNVFLYVDPFGIKFIHMDVFRSANIGKFNTIELLINFNSFGFLREGCRILSIPYDMKENETVFCKNGEIKNNKNNMNLVFGSDDWIKILERYKSIGGIDGYDAEKELTKKYCENMSKICGYKYVLNMPIKIERQNHPKYRMIFATNNEDGLMLMNDNMSNRVEVMKCIQDKGQMSLNIENVENEILSDTLENIVVNELKNYDDYININTLLCNVISNFGVMKASEIKDTVKELAENEKIIIKRTPELTPTGKKSSFMDSNNKQMVEVVLK